MAGLALALLGSGEFEPWTETVDRDLLERSSTGDGRVLILPTASAPEGDEIFDMWASKGMEHYAEAGIKAELIPLKTREDAHDPELIASLGQASMIFVSGGNPAYLANTLAGTPFWQALRQALTDGMAYAGCSAGAACLGQSAPDSSANEFTAEIWQPGLQLLPSVYVGAHGDVLDSYIPGLRDFFIASVPKSGKLIAIDERTAIVGDGTKWTVHGSGSAAFMANGSWLKVAAGDTFTAVLTE